MFPTLQLAIIWFSFATLAPAQDSACWGSMWRPTARSTHVPWLLSCHEEGHIQQYLSREHRTTIAYEHHCQPNRRLHWKSAQKHNWQQLDVGLQGMLSVWASSVGIHLYRGETGLAKDINHRDSSDSSQALFLGLGWICWQQLLGSWGSGVWKSWGGTTCHRNPSEWQVA